MTALLDLLLAAAAGRFPPADARVEVFGSPPGLSDAVVAFTAHHVVAADVPAREILERLDPDDGAVHIASPGQGESRERAVVCRGLTSSSQASHSVTARTGWPHARCSSTTGPPPASAT